MPELEETLDRFFSAEPRVLQWGAIPADPPPNAAKLREWVAGGRHAGLSYMEKNLEKRTRPKALAPWAQSIILFSYGYENKINPRHGSPYKVARYAQEADYHGQCRALLARLKDHLSERSSLRFFGFVDSAPVFERDLASEAGLGWRGKNCCTIHPGHGSNFFIAGCLVDFEVRWVVPALDMCGSCSRCLSSCPTDAFVSPGVLDSNKCISYWTIENKEDLPPEMSSRFEGWIFGCDICQEVCPWNQKALRELNSENGKNSKDGRNSNDGQSSKNRCSEFEKRGSEWLELLAKSGGFQKIFKKTPLTRAGRRRMLRNVLAAARGYGDTSVAAGIQRARDEEEDPAILAEVNRAYEALIEANTSDETGKRPADDK